MITETIPLKDAKAIENFERQNSQRRKIQFATVAVLGIVSFVVASQLFDAVFDSTSARVIFGVVSALVALFVVFIYEIERTDPKREIEKNNVRDIVDSRLADTAKSGLTFSDQIENRHKEKLCLDAKHETALLFDYDPRQKVVNAVQLSFDEISEVIVRHEPTDVKLERQLERMEARFTIPGFGVGTILDFAFTSTRSKRIDFSLSFGFRLSNRQQVHFQSLYEPRILRPEPAAIEKFKVEIPEIVARMQEHVDTVMKVLGEKVKL